MSTREIMVATFFVACGSALIHYGRVIDQAIARRDREYWTAVDRRLFSVLEAEIAMQQFRRQPRLLRLEDGRLIDANGNFIPELLPAPAPD